MKKIFNKVLNKLLGRKYYAIVVDYMGLASLSAELWLTKESAMKMVQTLEMERRSQYKLYMVSFRSRNEFMPEVIERNHVSYAKD